jgi:hypothetical protein
MFITIKARKTVFIPNGKQKPIEIKQGLGSIDENLLSNWHMQDYIRNGVIIIFDNKSLRALVKTTPLYNFTAPIVESKAAPVEAKLQEIKPKIKDEEPIKIKIKRKGNK